jgi:hypothetical protein
MRRVLGRSWVQVYREVKNNESVGGNTSSVQGDKFRDLMAEQGVPLTGKEVRALGTKYGASSSQGINVDKLMKETFKGPLGVGTAAAVLGHTAAHMHGGAAAGARPSTSAAHTLRGTVGAASARPSAFVRPMTASATGSPGPRSAMSSKPVF